MRHAAVALTLALGCSRPESPRPTVTPVPPSAPVAQPSNPAPATTTPAAPGTPTEPSAGPPSQPGVAAPGEADLRAVTLGLNTVGLSLYRQLRTAPGNLALSPASVALAFGMTTAGASAETLAEMRQVLQHTLGADAMQAGLGSLSQRWQSAPDAPLRIASANRLFGKQGHPWRPAFLSLTRERYGAELEPTNFGEPEPARRHINAWVSERTNTRIPEILPSGSLIPLTRLVLVNALYLDAPWQTAFDRGQSRPAPFFVNGAAASDVTTMHAQRSYGYAHRDGVSVVELPYRGGEYVFDLLLPDARDGLAALEQRLDGATLAALVDNLPRAQVNLSLPRFRVEQREPVSLKSALQQLGMRRAFSSSEADFSAMAEAPSPDERLYLMDAFHRVFVDVREEGTEAAAATAVVVGARGMGAPPPRPVEVNADHPFVFVVRDRTNGAVLFVGRVVDPRG